MIMRREQTHLLRESLHPEETIADTVLMAALAEFAIYFKKNQPLLQELTAFIH